MDIVEHVARAMNDRGDRLPKWEDASEVTRSVSIAETRRFVKATLEHLRDNVSEGMWRSAAEEMDGWTAVYSREAAEPTIKAALSQALKELDLSEGWTGS